jgi:protoporphyrinogen oxidase
LRLAELLVSVPLLLVTRRAGQPIASYYSRIVGPRNYEQVFKPMIDAVACQDTSAFGVEYLFKKRPSRRKDYPRSFTLAGGLGTLIEALASTPGIALETGAAAVATTRVEGVFRVRLADGSMRAARTLALAVPPAEGAALLGGCFPDVAGVLTEIRMNRLRSVGAAVGRDEIRLPTLAGIVACADRFYSVVSRDVVAHPECRGFTFHFRPGNRDGQSARMAEVLGLDRNRLEPVGTKEHEIPTLGPDHAARVARLDGLIAGRNLLLTGNYLRGLSLEDCAARSAAEASRLAAILD